MNFAIPRLISAFALAATMTLGGCAAYQPAPSAINAAALQPYRLDSGDRLRVTVFDQAGLTNTYTVDQAGYIAFPLVGQIPARGRTAKQVEAAHSSAKAICAIPMSALRSIAIAQSS